MTTPARSKILWRCRRGLRELDLLFKQYVAEHFDHLEGDQIRNLEDLLNEADLDIMRWIMGHKEPPHPEYVEIIEAMRVLKNRRLNSN